MADSPPYSDNAGMWHNFTVWTAQHLRYTVNMTRYAPSLEDLVWAGPRMVMRLGSFISLPDAADAFGQRTVAEATVSGIFDASTAAAAAVSGPASSSSSSASTAAAAAAAAESLVSDQDSAALVSKFSMEGAKGLGSVFSYATSKLPL